MKVSETQGNEDSICAVLGLSPFFEEALSWREPETGVTALGYAVTWGYSETSACLLGICRLCTKLFGFRKPPVIPS